MQNNNTLSLGQSTLQFLMAQPPILAVSARTESGGYEVNRFSFQEIRIRQEGTAIVLCTQSAFSGATDVVHRIELASQEDADAAFAQLDGWLRAKSLDMAMAASVVQPEAPAAVSSPVLDHPLVQPPEAPEEAEEAFNAVKVESKDAVFSTNTVLTHKTPAWKRFLPKTLLGRFLAVSFVSLLVLLTIVVVMLLRGNHYEQRATAAQEAQRSRLLGAAPESAVVAGIGGAAASAPGFAAMNATQPIAAQHVAEDAKMKPEEKAVMLKLPGIIGNTKAEKVFYAFSDPLCPFCRRLEAVVNDYKAQGGQYEVVYIPVAYRDGAADVVSSIMCANDRAAAWRAVMAPNSSGSNVTPCDAGKDVVKKHNAFFESMRLGSTPTLVINDVLVTGSPTNAQQLKTLLGS